MAMLCQDILSFALFYYLYYIRMHAYPLHLLNRLLRLTCTYLGILNAVTNFSHVILPDRS